MTEPTKRDCLIDFIMREFFDASPEFINYPKVQEDNQLVVKICDRIRQQYPDLAASAQSAEPQDGHVLLAAALAAREVRNEAPWGIDPEDGPSYAEPQEAEAQAWAECKAERIDDSWTVGETANYRGFFKLGYDAAIRARLASKPSRSEAPEPDTRDEAVRYGRMAVEIWRCSEHPGGMEWIAQAGKWIAKHDADLLADARPSREEEMRALLVEIYNWITEYNMHWRSYSVSERLKLLNRLAEIQDKARAALAQGGARDEGEGKR